MSDLVEQLRAAGYRFRQIPEIFGPRLYSMEKKDFIPHNKPCLYDKAADEIERLQAALLIAAGKLSTLPPYTDSHPETIHKALLEDGTKEWETNRD